MQIMVQQLEFSKVNLGIPAAMKDGIFFEKMQEAPSCIEVSYIIWRHFMLKLHYK